MSALRAFYFLYYGSVAALLSYFPAYLRGLGFAGEQIGAVFAPAQVIAVPMVLVWGSLADRVAARSRALQLCTLGALAAIGWLPWARTPLQVGAILFALWVFNCGTIPLVDSIAIETVAAAKVSYARTRLFGSIGFVIVAQSLGLWLSARGDLAGDKLVPFAMVALGAGFVLTSFFVPRSERAAHLPRPRAREALALLRGPLPLLLLLCGLHWMALAPYHLLFGVFVRDLHQPAQLIGLLTALAVLAEVGALLAYPWIRRRLSLRTLLAIAFAASALRWLLLSRAHAPAALAALQLLHAASFGLWWGASVQAMSELVPPALRATGQTLFSAFVFGVGNAAGYALAGAGYDRFGGVAPLFAAAAGVELLALGLLLAGRLGVETSPANAES